MATDRNSYKTLATPSPEILFKDRKSKFFASAFPIEHEDEVKPIIESIQKKHPTANHVCYAWQLGVESPHYRANDDGEPNNSAGMPIYGQMQAFEITNVLVAVARIFGGTKLGVGGLISAYRTSTKMALEVSKIQEKTLNTQLRISFAYASMGKVMRIIKKHQLEIVSQKMKMDCTLTILVPRSESASTKSLFVGMNGIHIKTVEQ